MIEGKQGKLSLPLQPFTVTRSLASPLPPQVFPTVETDEQAKENKKGNAKYHKEHMRFPKLVYGIAKGATVFRNNETAMRDELNRQSHDDSPLIV